MFPGVIGGVLGGFGSIFCRVGGAGSIICGIGGIVCRIGGAIATRSGSFVGIIRKFNLVFPVDVWEARYR